MGYVNYRRQPLVFNEIGKPVNDLSMKDALHEAGLDFKVGIVETRVRLPNPYYVSDDSIHNYGGKYLLYKVPGSYATFREDNNHVFGAVGSKYQVVQNDVALDFIEKVCNYDKSVRIETAGCYNYGATMLVTAKYPIPFSISDRDEVDRYLLFTNSHDGSGSIECAVTNIRVICNNMLNAALRNASSRFSFKHTKNVKQAIMNAVDNIRLSENYMKMQQQDLQLLSDIKVKDNNIKGYVYSLFLDNAQKEYAMNFNSIYDTSDEFISVRLRNKIVSVMNTIESGCGQELHRGTVLWLYNGVTCYLNNVVEYKSAEDKLESLTKRIGFKLNQKAYDLAISAISRAV